MYPCERVFVSATSLGRKSLFVDATQLMLLIWRISSTFNVSLMNIDTALLIYVNRISPILTSMPVLNLRSWQCNTVVPPKKKIR